MSEIYRVSISVTVARQGQSGFDGVIASGSVDTQLWSEYVSSAQVMASNLVKLAFSTARDKLEAEKPAMNVESEPTETESGLDPDDPR